MWTTGIKNVHHDPAVEADEISFRERRRVLDRIDEAELSNRPPRRWVGWRTATTRWRLDSIFCVTTVFREGIAARRSHRSGAALSPRTFTCSKTGPIDGPHCRWVLFTASSCMCA